jgi:hypothetical protein
MVTTFHVAGFDDKERYDSVMSLSAACSPVAHEEEGLHASFDFIINSEGSVLLAL